MLTHVWIIPGLMAVSFLAILLLGKRFSERVTSGIGIFFIGLCFVLACVTSVNWIQRVNDPVPDPSAAEAVISQPSDAGPAPVPGMSDAEAVVGAEVGPAEAATDQSHAAGETTPTTTAEAATSAESTASGEAATSAESGGEEHEAKAAPIITRWTWFQIGDIHFEFGFIADGLSILMLFTVTAISLLVHIYSKEYLHDDVRFTHYFAFLSLFSAAMLFYVTSSNTIQMLTGWELVGVCSFALIGHWWEDKNNSDAALKAFLTNRVGDVGLIIGVIITFFAAGSTSFNVLHINQYALSPGANQTLLLIGALCLFGGVTSKSGQFPLHTWLPDAMAGPTPVSALIHAASMVVAGVYLIARLYSVFYEGLNIGDNWINYVAVIGAITIVGGAALAFVQTDIKKVLAYSTISQLGYMVMALGVGAWTGAIFHLFTHAFFKACLFLGAGSVSHAAHHTFDMRKMGGLRKYMPATFKTFIIGTIALMGIFPLAGFWSKDEVLAGSLNGQGGHAYLFMTIAGLLGALMTCAYMSRAIYLTFFGEYRGHGTPHESPKVMTVPLWILAGGAIVLGLVNLPNWFKLGDVAYTTRFEHYVEPTFAFPVIDHAEFNLGLALGSLALAALGIFIAYQYYWLEKSPLIGLKDKSKVFGRGYWVLENKYGLDHLYTDIIVGGVKGPIARASYWFNNAVIDTVVNTAGKASVASGRVLYAQVDQKVVDGLVLSTGAGAEESGEALRHIQTGRVQQYAALLFGGAVILALIFVFFV
ncbi:MAG: NADH-quinone oxidoreductase subunit L [Acidimicrobiales bacterium]